MVKGQAEQNSICSLETVRTETEKALCEGVIDLYLSVKIRTSDEVMLTTSLVPALLSSYRSMLLMKVN
jgi:hypothetical protein